MICKDNSDWQPSADDVANWTSAYGSRCNVNNELQKMEAWLNCNPLKRKTQTGMRRFVNSWLSRAAEKGGSPALTQSEVTNMKIDGFDPDIRDAIFAKLQEVMAFYGKEISHSDLRIWCKALINQKLPDILEALDQHILTGRYAPRPVDVLEKTKELRGRPEYQPVPKRAETPSPGCPERISRAWMWYTGKFMSGGMTTGLFLKSVSEATPEDEERYLQIVNEEAFRTNNPDAILDEHKFVEIWGNVSYG